MGLSLSALMLCCFIRIPQLLQHVLAIFGESENVIEIA